MKIRGLFIWIVTISFVLSACGVGLGKGTVTNLTKDIKPETRIAKETDVKKEDMNKAEKAIFDFSAKLFQKSSSEDKNSMISPLSVLYALGMTANGADQETLSEMEAVFGLKTEELNAFLSVFSKNTKKQEKSPLRVANSLWIKDDESFTANKDFLSKNVSIYDAEVFKLLFDKKAIKTMNDWVSTKTDGMIPSIIDEIPDEAVMYLMNALTFDAKWLNPYKDYEVTDYEFMNWQGKKKPISMMWGREDVYLENEKVEGFVKPYEGSDYSFVALLPKQGISIFDYSKGLTGEELKDLWEKRERVPVMTGLPKFKSEYDIEMNKVLKELGMKSAFDGEKANFSKLGKAVGNLFISRVLHKTFIEVNNEGTRAAALTAVEVTGEAARLEEPKKVTLDKPFIYMIVERKTGLPIFMGTVLDLEKEN